MILIIHGNDTTSSRNFYFEEKNKAKNPIFLNGDGLLFDDIFRNAENKSLFEQSNTLIIENFFVKTKSNTIEFKKVLEYLNSNKGLEAIFWDNNEISKTTLAQVKSATVMQFSYPQVLFTFLDNIKPNNSNSLINLFHDLEKNMEPELIFFMLVRQFRLLISHANDERIDEIKRMAPWQLSKLKRQSDYFDKQNLLKLYSTLYDIDLGQKTGKFPYTMEKSIDFFLLGL